MAIPTNVFSGSFTTSLTAFFKTRYPQRKVDLLLATDKPTLSAIKRSDELTGIQTIIPMQLDLPQGQSASLRSAIDNASPVYGKAWTITPVAGYGGIRLDARTLMAAKNDQGSFFRLRERDYEGQIQMMGLELEKHLWSDGTASAGQLSADPGTATTFTLATPSDAIGIHINEVIRFYDNDGTGGAPLTERAGGTRRVTGVNFGTGVVTVDAALDASLAASDHVVRDGNVNSVLSGIPAWIPASDPTDTWFGVARTLHPQQLGGWRQAFLGNIEETAMALDSTMRRVNQKPKTLWLSYSNWARLSLELGARAYREPSGDAKFGYGSLIMTCPGGPVTVRCAPYVPENAGFMLDMSSWTLMTLGAVPHIVEDDGLTARVIGVASRDGSLAEDGIEIRLRQFSQLVCDNPFANGRFAIG
jgi:hypothetical protein